MGDILGVALTVLLLLANAFFVGAEFALISARRDRLEALAEQGKRSAVTVMRAGQDLSVMLAPPYLLWVRATRPIIAFYDWCAHITLRAVGVEPKTELENTVSAVELSEM